MQSVEKRRDGLTRYLIAIVFLITLGQPATSWAQFGTAAQIDLEDPPISYSTTVANNRVSKLMNAIQHGDVKLTYDRDRGYLESILGALEIPVSSQGLVFSKTSLQVSFISPRTPRAVYFNDDTYVGWVKGSSLMEISTNDPKLGVAFYSVRMFASKPRFKRELYTCLACHASAMTQGVPGHTVRSVKPKPDGTMDAQQPSFVTDHTSPFSKRWGGWYVTGRHGDMQHMGNAVLRGGQLVAFGDANRLRLQYEFHTKDWLSPHSDIVALMVLEHQTQMHNTFTVADFMVRRATYEHLASLRVRDSDATPAEMNSSDTAATDRKTPDIPASVQEEARRELRFVVQRAAEKVVDCMLFVEEAPLTSQIQPSTSFSQEFTARGPSDSLGRSLRDFDLKSRIFRYPCSYLIYSSTFESLQPKLREAIYQRLWDVLTEDQRSEKYAHVSTESRIEILEILRATKVGLPSYWKGLDNKTIEERARKP